MATISVNMDSPNGDVLTLPVFELNYEQMLSDIPSAFDTSAEMLNTPTTYAGVTIHKFLVSDATIKNYLPANIPMQHSRYGLPDGVESSIIPTNLNIADFEIFDAASYGMERVTGSTTPTDFSTSVHYHTIAQNDWSLTPDGNFRPYASYRITEGFQPDNTTGQRQFLNYRDVNGAFSKLLYTNTGAHFYIGKIGMYGAESGSYRVINPNTAIMGTRPYFANSWSDLYESEKKIYGICTADDEPICDYMTNPAQGYLRFDGGIDQSYAPAYSSRVAWSNVNMYPFFVHYRVNGQHMYGVAFSQYTRNYDNADYPYKLLVFAMDAGYWGSSVHPDGGSWGDETQPSENDGTFYAPSDNVSPQSDYGTTKLVQDVNSALSGLFSGLTGVYNIFMIDTAGTGTSRLFTELSKIFGILYDDTPQGFLKRYEQTFYNPLSAVVSTHLLPYQFAASALFSPLRSEKMSVSGYSISDAIASKYSQPAPTYNTLQPLGRVLFDAVDMPAVLGGYADFAPYTQCILHLPYIGAVEIKTNAIAHGRLTVEYICDVISGNVIARICCRDHAGNEQYIQSASGNCAYNIPLYSMQQDGGAVGKLISSAAGIVSGALTGNAAGVLTGAAGVVGAAVESSFSPRSVQISGEIGGNNMLMSHRDVWLEIIRPAWTNSRYFRQLHGIPSGMSNTIADSGSGSAYDGFLQIESIDLEPVNATDEEKQEIETLLKQGVFIRAAELFQTFGNGGSES